MLHLLLLVLTSGHLALSAVINPELTEWYELTTDYEYHNFPLNEYILEIKTFLPHDFETNPLYGVGRLVEKFTTRRLELFDSGNRVGQLVWNTISYDTPNPKDLWIAECDVRYERYRAFPAGGKSEQIWALNFMDDKVEFSCDDFLQYEQYWEEGDGPRFVPPGFPQIDAEPAKCRALGAANVDRILFRFLKGEFIRARPKNTSPAVPDATDPPVFETSTEEPISDDNIYPTDPEEPEEPEETEAPVEEQGSQPTCDCWTAACGYCSNPECHVQHDIAQGVSIWSKLQTEEVVNIMLLDGEGLPIGTFSWSKKAIYLTGCIGCRAPRAVGKLSKISANWVFKLEDGLLTLSSGDDVLYSHKLKGECADRYSQVQSFTFYDMSCESSFNPADMTLGSLMNENCGGACQA